MAFPSKVYCATNTLGVYYTSSFVGPETGQQPSWAAVNAGLPNTLCKQFALDPHAPETRQFVLLTDGSLYKREGAGDWTEVLTAATAGTALGISTGQPTAFCCDTLIPGVLYVSHTGSDTTPDPHYLKSIDYGATWAGGKTYASSTIKTRLAGTIRAHGNNVYIGWTGRTTTSVLLLYSTNGGATWSNVYFDNLLWQVYPHLNPLSPEFIYSRMYEGGPFDTYTAPPLTELRTDRGPNGPSAMRFHPTDVDRQLMLYLNRVCKTYDGWATIDAESPGDLGLYLAAICPQWWADDDVIIGHTYESTYAISAIQELSDTTPTPLAGTNYNTSPYTNAIPATHGGICWDGIQAIIETPHLGPTLPPDGGTITTPGGGPVTLVGTGGTVQAVSMPGYTGDERGVPMAGDRAAWDETLYAALHARDLKDATFIHHMDPLNPKVSQADFDEHVAAANPHGTSLNDLADVDTTGVTDGQTVLYDDTTGTWLPGLITPVSHVHVFQEDHSATCDSSEMTFDTTYIFDLGTTMVWLNGLLQQPGAGKDYTESALGDSITFAAAPLTDDILIIAYIKSATQALTGPYTGLAGTEILVLIQTHDHTTESDGSYTPAEVVAYYAAAGYDVLALTDHDLVTTQPAGIGTAITANELSPSTAHILSLNSDYTRGTVTDEQALVNAIVADGGQAIIAHPNWYIGMTYAQLAALANHLGIEIHNALCVGGAGGYSPITYPGFAVALWDQLLTNVSRSIWGTASDDFHALSYKTGYNIGRIRAFVTTNTLSNVMAALVAGDFVADVSNDGVTPGIPTITGTGVGVSCVGATAIRFIGDSGALLQEDTGEDGEYTFVGTEKYVRIEAVGDYTEGFGAAIDTVNRWGVSGGTWAVAGGTLNQMNTADDDADYLFLKRHTCGDVEVLCDIMLPASDAQQAGLCMLALDNQNFYYVRLAKNADGVTNPNTISLYKAQGGVYTIMGSAVAFTPTGGTWYRMRVVYTHATGTFQIRIWEAAGAEPGTWHIEQADTTWKWGAFAFRSRRQSSFDNLWINGFKTYYQPIPVGDWA